MGFFGRLFGGGQAAMPPADLSVLGADMHSHFIPGIDDGAPTLEASLELITAMHGLGYRKVITTPHVMADGYRNTPEKIKAGLETVRAAVRDQGLAIEVDAAAEYYLDHELEGKVQRKEVLTFGDNLLLFELPFISEPQILLNVVFTMQTQGYRPVLAHPERYGFWHNDLSSAEKLKERGVLFQLNTVALMGAYGPAARKAAEKYIDLGWYELLGSDCHRMDHIEAIKATLTEPYLHKVLGSGRLMNSGL
ncbi:MAG: capsular biosynthesis protein [Flavobacteriales bacterium]|jgi:protein-tyrosine phosphatase|nr:capsular biosynthesis protein [Flavobacteriales bacterium]MBK9286916.1 capsular biosynthesis protein [Flavobacteriales bacterium]MBL0034987.1 capsular biosynthesis protein [Flavobacteriales bacterium]